MAWKGVLEAVGEDVHFWDSHDEDGSKKPLGWNFLAMEDPTEEEEGSVEGESEYEEEDEDSEEEASDDDDDDSDVR